MARFIAIRLLQFPLILAVIAALWEFLPVVGPLLAVVPAVAIALLVSPTQALVVFVFYAVVQVLQSYVLMPNIVRQQTQIPPLLILFALLAGASIGGVLGVVVAIPLAGALQVLTLQVVAPGVRRWSGAHEPETSPESASAG